MTLKCSDNLEKMRKNECEDGKDSMSFLTISNLAKKGWKKLFTQVIGLFLFVLRGYYRIMIFWGQINPINLKDDELMYRFYFQQIPQKIGWNLIYNMSYLLSSQNCHLLVPPLRKGPMNSVSSVRMYVHLISQDWVISFFLILAGL